jgi:hypothetical protein
MRCNYILIFGFKTDNGLLNNEVENGVAAYKKKYEGRANGVFDITVNSANKEWKKDADDQFKKIISQLPALASTQKKKLGGHGLGKNKSEINDLSPNQNKMEQPDQDPSPTIGLYLLAHGNHENTDPPLKDLVPVVAGFIMGCNFKFRKINLMACAAAGLSPSVDLVNKTVLGTFCELLKKQMVHETARLDGLAVCGYQAVTATYDPDTEYYRKKYNENNNKVISDGTDWSADKGKVRTLIKEIRKDHFNWRTTHPMTIDMKKYDTLYDGIKGDAETNYKGNDKPKIGDKLKNAQISFRFRTLADEALKDTQLKQMWQYMQTKRVLVCESKTNVFRKGSLADYTENGTIRDLVTLVGKLKDGYPIITAAITT